MLEPSDWIAHSPKLRERKQNLGSFGQELISIPRVHLHLPCTGSCHNHCSSCLYSNLSLAAAAPWSPLHRHCLLGQLLRELAYKVGTTATERETDRKEEDQSLLDNQPLLTSSDRLLLYGDPGNVRTRAGRAFQWGDMHHGNVRFVTSQYWVNLVLDSTRKPKNLPQHGVENSYLQEQRRSGKYSSLLTVSRRQVKPLRRLILTD